MGSRQRMVWLPYGEKIDMFSRFDRQTDGRTEGQTEGQTDIFSSIVRAMHARRAVKIVSKYVNTCIIMDQTTKQRISKSILLNPARKCDGDVFLFVCSSVRSFVCLSPVKFVKSFSTWQHLAVSGGLSCRLRYTC